MRVGMFTYGMGEHLTGIGRYARELCLALRTIDPRIEIILINPYNQDQQDFFHQFENYHVPVLSKLPSVLAFGPTLFPIISRKLGLDIIHDPCGISPFLFPRKKDGTRRIVTIHDAVPYVFPQVHPFLTKFTFQTLIRMARWSTDAILTVSENSRDDLISYVGFPPEQVHVAYQGVSLPSTTQLEERRRDLRVLNKWNLHKPYFLYVGALNPRKNVPTLIAAFKRVVQYRSECKLVLVGPKTWWSDETLKAAESVKDSVVITGYVSDIELGSLYTHASALVYPSIYEGFGLPPLEAMAYGAPVITSNVSSLPEVVGNAGIMVDPMDFSALAASMIKVLHPRVRQHLSKRGRQRASSFRWETTARDTLRVFQMTIASK